MGQNFRNLSFGTILFNFFQNCDGWMESAPLPVSVGATALIKKCHLFVMSHFVKHGFSNGPVVFYAFLLGYVCLNW